MEGAGGTYGVAVHSIKSKGSVALDNGRAGTVGGVGNGASGSTFEVDIESLSVGESSRGHQ